MKKIKSKERPKPKISLSIGARTQMASYGLNHKASTTKQRAHHPMHKLPELKILNDAGENLRHPFFNHRKEQSKLIQKLGQEYNERREAKKRKVQQLHARKELRDKLNHKNDVDPTQQYKDARILQPAEVVNKPLQDHYIKWRNQNEIGEEHPNWKENETHEKRRSSC